MELTFPFEIEGQFVMENTLPQVYGDQFLIIKCYYEDVQVYIDGKQVFQSFDNYLFGVASDVGKKEIHVLMKPEYSGKNIQLVINLQKSLYGAEVYGIFISTRSGFAVYTIKNQWLQITFAIILMFTGIIESMIGIHFILRKSLILRKLSFEALVFAGFFSILSSVWLICQTRLLYIIFGNQSGFAILEIIVFLLMPLAFFELIRAVNFRVSFFDNLVDGILGLLILILFFACLAGACDWGQIIVVGHFIDLIVVLFGAYYSYSSIKEEKRRSERRLIAVGNLIFLAVCLISLAMYINSIDSNYNVFIVFGLIVYISTQVGIIYRRIGLKVEEEAELVQVKEFAYTDELTRLTNRRYFYEEINAMEERELMRDTTIVYIDVNRLKYYNDNMGHDAGDELLIGTADCLRQAFSDCSTSVISRIGGDEFIVMLLTSESDLNKRIDLFKTRAANWKGKFIDGLTASVGVASIRDYPDASIEDLCKYADDNMFFEKKKYYAESGFERRNG